MFLLDITLLRIRLIQLKPYLKCKLKYTLEFISHVLYEIFVFLRR